MILTALAFLGCGGSSGSSATLAPPATPTVSGVAAAGGVVTGDVYLKDSAATPKELHQTTANGAYSFDVTGMTKPFILKVVGTVNGTNYSLYSFATDKGTANINPLSQLMVADAAAGIDPATIYAAPEVTTMQAIANKLPQAVLDIQNNLKPLLQAYSANSVNPITTPYAAKGSGIDGMFDAVAIDVSSGTVTVTNKENSNTIFTGSITNMAGGTFIYRVVFAGDSITAANIYDGLTDSILGGPITGFAPKLMATLPSLYPGNTFYSYNEGVNGTKSSDWVSWVTSKITIHSPDIVVLMLGTNDAAADVGVSLSAYEINIRSIIRQIWASNAATKILLLTPPPVYEGKPTLTRTNAVTSTYAQKIRDIAADIGGNLTLVEIWNPISAHATDSNYADWWCPIDGIHPMQMGHNVIYDAINTKLATLV